MSSLYSQLFRFPQTNALLFFGGTLNHIHNRPTTIAHDPILGLYSTPHPNYFRFNDGRFNGDFSSVRYRKPESFPIGSKHDLWPINYAYLEDVQQADFWGVHVAKFDDGALTPPRIIGMRVYKGDKTPAIRSDIPHHRLVFGEDYYHFADVAGELVQEFPVPPNPNDYEKWQADQRMRIKSHVLQTALRVKQDKVAFEFAKDQAEKIVILRQAIEENNLGLQNEFLAESYRLWTEMQPCYDYVTWLLQSSYRDVKLQARLLCSKLRDQVPIEQRLGMAEVSSLLLLITEEKGRDRMHGAN